MLKSDLSAAEADSFVSQACANGSITSVQGAATEYAARKQAEAQARGQWIEQQEAADAAAVQEMLAAQQAAAQKRRAEEAKARQQAYQDYRAGERNAGAVAAEYQAHKAVQVYRAGEREEYVSPHPVCTAENVEKPKSAGSSESRPWWQRAGEWVQQKIIQPCNKPCPRS